MTLIVYDKDALYADDRFVVEHKGYQQRWARGTKLFMSPCHRAAIAILGQGFAPEDEPLAVEYVAYAAVHIERRHHGGKDLPEFTEMPHIFNGGDTSFLVMTKKKLYHYKDAGQMDILNGNIHHCYGTGAGPFNVCMEAGMDIDEAYKAVNRVVWSSGPLAKTIKRDQLLEIKPWVNRTKDQLDHIAEMNYIESGEERWVNEGGRSWQF